MLSLSVESLKQIKDKIQIELLKRGFMATIKLELDSKNNNIRVLSESFQTTPVIFKSIVIDNFGGSITEKKENLNNSFEVWVPIHISYEHFDMGSNGCSLFSFSCTVVGDNVYSVLIQ